jgi:hypothetical protein
MLSSESERIFEQTNQKNVFLQSSWNIREALQWAQKRPFSSVSVSTSMGWENK